MSVIRRFLCLGAILAAVTAVFAIKYGLTPRNIRPDDADEVFRSYICKSIPDGVENIQVRGGTSIASTSIELCMNVIDRTALEVLISDAGFSPVSQTEYNDLVRSTESPKLQLSYYERLGAEGVGRDVLEYDDEAKLVKIWIVR